MASSESNRSNLATDISHVLETMGSLIGELDAINVDKVDAQDSTDYHALNNDLSLETLLAYSDNFDDSDDQNSCKNLCFQKSPPSLFSHSNCHGSHHNSMSSTQDRGPVHDLPADCTESKSVSTSQSNPLQLQNAAISRTQECETSSTQSSFLQFYNSMSSRTQVNGSRYAYQPLGTHHKGAINEVALSQEVHGSFRTLEKGSSAGAVGKSVFVPAPYPKAEPNHYDPDPGELDCSPRSTLSNYAKSDAGGIKNMSNIQQMKCIRRKEEQVPVNVFNEENKPTELLVSSTLKAREACHKLVLLNKAEDDPQWVMVEHLTDLGLERNLEDHESVLAVLNTWAPGSNNKLLFRKDVKKYHFFAHTSNYFPPDLLDSENSDKAVTEKAQKAKVILHQKLFSTCTRIPELEGTLQCKEFGKKSWNKKFLFLRGSGIYSNKGKSKVSKDLECYVQFDGANLYNILNPKKSHKSPTEFCFCIVPFRARELKDLKCFCVDDGKTLMSWKIAVRIAKFGPQLRQSYDDMLRKFTKLTKYCEQQTWKTNGQNTRGETEEGDKSLKEGQVAMDFTGNSGRIITDGKVIQELANTRNKVKLSRRSSCNSFIPTDTGFAADDFISEAWYHGRITREKTLELLMSAGVQDGLFLVRESCTVAGVFVLTFCMNQSVYHCQLVQDIGKGTQVFFSLGKGPAFRTLHELIHFYQQKPLNGVSLALRIPCPKS